MPARSTKAEGVPARSMKAEGGTWHGGRGRYSARRAGEDSTASTRAGARRQGARGAAGAATGREHGVAGAATAAPRTAPSLTFVDTLCSTIFSIQANDKTFT